MYVCSTLLGGLLGLISVSLAPNAVDAVVPVDNCTGAKSCVPSSSSVGPLVVNWVNGTGHRSGTCGCVSDDAEEPEVNCQETTKCQANYVANVVVGVGNFGSTSNGCQAADASGVVSVNVACSGCSCDSISIAIDSCTGMNAQGNCTGCGQTTAVVSGCSRSVCPSKNCD